MNSYKNRAGHEIKVGDLVFGYSPGVWRIAKIHESGIATPIQVFTGNMKPVEKARESRTFHLDYARPATKEALLKQMDDVREMLQNLMNNYEGAISVVDGLPIDYRTVSSVYMADAPEGEYYIRPKASKEWFKVTLARDKNTRSLCPPIIFEFAGTEFGIDKDFARESEWATHKDNNTFWL